MGDVEVRVLGAVEVLVNGGPVPAGGEKQRTVLALLAIAAGQRVSVNALRDAVWGYDTDRSPATLQVYVSNLRGVLGAGPEAIVQAQGGYRLDTERVGVDAIRFERAVAAGAELLRAEDWGPAAAELAGALALWQGDEVAADLDCPDLEGRRIALAELRLRALDGRLLADLGCDRHREVVAELQELCARHPTREAFWCHLMRALYHSDRRPEAFAVPSEAREFLVERAGLDPGPRLREVERELLLLDSAAVVAAETPSLTWRDASGVSHARELRPDDSPITVGRNADNDIVLAWDGKVSRHHAELVHAGGRTWQVVDRDSTNGTSVNGRPVHAPADLTHVDLLRFGETIVCVLLPGQTPAPPLVIEGATHKVSDEFLDGLTEY